MKYILKNKGKKEMKKFQFNYSFIFRKEERIHRLERDLADEKKKSERLLENMVILSFHILYFFFIIKNFRILN